MAAPRLTGLLRRLHAGLAPAAAGPTDRDALRAFVATREESAFAALVQRHGPMVLRVCRRVLQHAEDAEDAFQATFLVLARKATVIGKAESLSSWLHGVALRTALRARRDAGRRRARERQAPLPAPADPMEDLAWRDIQVLLETEIHRLPERYRSAFVLCHLEGRSRAEAAAELGVEENTVSSRLARARDRLRDRLARRGVHLSAVLAATVVASGEAVQAVPVELATVTVSAAARFAARLPITGVSNCTLQLTNGTIQTMAIAKLKWAAGVLAVGGTLAVGTWGMGQGPGAPSGPPGGAPAEGGRDEKPGARGPAADYAQRQRSLKNLKKILVAMHNYHDTNNRFPTDITDKAGKPLLSWRVELLPYLEQDNFYRQFNRDESWDSEHNLKLLAQMPDVFRVGFETKGATHTYYQRFAITGVTWGIVVDGAGSEGGLAPAGASGPPGGGFLPSGPDGIPRKLAPSTPPPGPMGGSGASGPVAPSSNAPRFPLRFTEVTDGLSNTLGVVEAGPPVPWTKPADVLYDAKKPLPAMTGPFINVRNAAALDGSTYPLKPNLDETTLRRLIDPNDGQSTPELKTLRARFPADTEEEKKALTRMIEENQAIIEKMERLSAENTTLIGLTNKFTKDSERAEEMQTWLNHQLEILKVVNQKYRAEIGLTPGQSLPKEALKRP